MCCTCELHVVYMWCTCGINVVYIWRTEVYMWYKSLFFKLNIKVNKHNKNILSITVNYKNSFALII